MEESNEQMLRKGPKAHSNNYNLLLMITKMNNSIIIIEILNQRCFRK